MKIDVNDEFFSQEDVDRCLDEAKRIADDLDSQEKAIELLKHIHKLIPISDSYFVPDIVHEWKDSAMEYVESPKTYFNEVLYDIFKRQHESFKESVEYLEDSVNDELLDEDILFDMVMTFNRSMIETNESCERYGAEKFPEYRFSSASLQSRYDKWIMGM